MRLIIGTALIGALLAGGTFTALPGAAQAQGLVGGARRGAAEGDRVGGPIGGVVGGAVGGAVGTVNGALGIDPGRRAYRSGLRSRPGYRARHRHHRR